MAKQIPVASSRKAAKKKVEHQEPARKIKGILEPMGILDRAFCEAWLARGKDQYNRVAAARAANVPENDIGQGKAKKLYDKFEPYLVRQKTLQESELARAIGLDQADILREMIAVAYANPLDYIVVGMEKQKGADGVEIEVQCTRRRPLNELTREQAAAISKVTFHPDGSVSYALPTPKGKRPFLRDLGQHIGMFHPNLIKEHRHAQAKAKLQFRDMDDEKLDLAEKMLMDALGPAGRQLLGYTEAEENEDAT